MKILAVDDEQVVLDLLTVMVRKVGFSDITTVSSGASALETIANAPSTFDCVLLDISMPDLDGIELCALIRTIPTYHKIPIIMLTARSAEEYIDRSFRAKATDYLNKPLDIVQLANRLQKAQEMIEGLPKRSLALARDTKDDGAEEVSLEREVSIDGVEDIVTFTALQNYLTQLSHVGIAGSQVVAVKVEPIESIFSRASREEFLYVLSEVADAISRAFASDRHLMAYTGNGTFVVVSNKVEMESSIPLEAEIQAMIEERQIEYDNGQPIDIDVSIGNPIRPSLHRTQRVKHTFERAIARAESRGQKKRGSVQPQRFRVVNS
ncbi:response regulator [Oceanicola sp. D3]|uniref:response regulator n=1 Tax=Oceanicola sp. D3 TaxID=2587163 RepID=UPI001120A549|nr:response regulator [Oceanicola sp. D3]QDC10047.1 response regulator [Oceanicola sp. D3]